MKIQLKDWRISKVHLELLPEEFKREKNTFNLETSSIFSEEISSNKFVISFNVSIEDKSFDITLEANFKFELLDEVITDEFRNSNFHKINAPAIAFPYLRAFISNITLQAGFEPVILPSINFVQLAEQKK